MASCSHFDPIALNNSDTEAATNFRKRKCDDCDEKEGLWICLKCQHVGCGRERNQHALQHHKKWAKKSHLVASEMGSGRIWCYKCDTEIVNGNHAKVAEEQLADNQNDILVENSHQSSGVVGLSNLGNTCYMNSAIQCLSHSPPIGLYFQSFTNASLKHFAHKPNNTVFSFSNLIKELWQDSSEVAVPLEFIREIKSKNAIFSGYSQQDSVEFLRHVLDSLNEGMKRRKNYDSPWTSIIIDTFRGELESTVKCLTCKKNSHTSECFFDLPVELLEKPANFELQYSIFHAVYNTISSVISSFIPKSLQLTDCFDAFTSKEILSGSNQYRCEACKRLSDCEKSFKIKQAPEILIVQLKRFRYNSYLPSKISAKVNFPINDFDISPYMSPNRKNKDDILRYDLIGIINHRGSIGGGHYVAYCKSDADSLWYEFDDSFTRPVSESYVRNVQAYVLFYRKKVLGKEEERSAIQKLSSGNLSEIALVSKNWYIKWKTLSNPGIITNSDFMCEHGHVNYRRIPQPEYLIERIPKKVFDFLSKKYGNDRARFTLYEPSGCKKCSKMETAWDNRRLEEKEAIKKIDISKGTSDEEESSNHSWYIISTEWISEWHEFMNGGLLPGPIRNIHLFADGGGDDDNDADKKKIRKGLRIGVHYRAVCEETWKYLHGRYGGGPEISSSSPDIYSSKFLK